MYYTDNCAVIPDPYCGQCPVVETARIQGIWFQKTSFAFASGSGAGSIYDPTAWQTAMAAGNVYVFPFTHGSLDVAKQTDTGFGNVPTVLTNYLYTLKVNDDRPDLNVPFWNAITNNFGFYCGYKTQSWLWLPTANASVTVTLPVADDLNKMVTIEADIEWQQNYAIVPITNAATVVDQIFMQCYATE
jgi:hypothetical protein